MFIGIYRQFQQFQLYRDYQTYWGMKDRSQHGTQNVNAYNRISFLRDKILALINVRPMHDLELGVPLNRLHWQSGWLVHWLHFNIHFCQVWNVCSNNSYQLLLPRDICRLLKWGHTWQKCMLKCSQWTNQPDSLKYWFTLQLYIQQQCSHVHTLYLIADVL
jgi:hypothetical protein